MRSARKICALPLPLPGIFPDNPDPYFANTNFWSVAIEFSWYLVTALLGVLALFRHRWSIVALFLLMYVSFGIFGDWMLSKDVPVLGLELKPTIRLGLYFTAGMLIYLYRDQFLQLDPRLLWMLVPAWIGTIALGWTDWTSPLFVPLIVLLVATFQWPWVHRLAAFGDPTYGMYIWGVPLQQIVVATLGTNWFVAFFVTVPLAYGVGLLSWHLIEKPALKYRKLLWVKNA